MAAVDDHSEISFSIPPGTLPWKPILIAVHSGVAGRRRLEAQPGALTFHFSMHISTVLQIPPVCISCDFAVVV